MDSASPFKVRSDENQSHTVALLIFRLNTRHIMCESNSCDSPQLMAVSCLCMVCGCVLQVAEAGGWLRAPLPGAHSSLGPPPCRMTFCFVLHLTTRIAYTT